MSGLGHRADAAQRRVGCPISRVKRSYRLTVVSIKMALPGLAGLSATWSLSGGKRTLESRSPTLGAAADSAGNPDVRRPGEVGTLRPVAKRIPEQPWVVNLGCAYRKLYPAIMMLKSAEDRLGPGSADTCAFCSPGQRDSPAADRAYRSHGGYAGTTGLSPAARARHGEADYSITSSAH